MLEPTEENKVIDPVYYVSFANPTGVQAILYSYGFPQAETFPKLYELITKLHAMYPDAVTKKLMEIHPDKETILKVTGEERKPAAFCGYTASELEQYKNEKSKLSKDELLLELKSLLALQQANIATHGVLYNIKEIDAPQQKIDIIRRLIVDKERAIVPAIPKAESILKNLTPYQKTIGVLAIGVLIGWGISALSSSK